MSDPDEGALITALDLDSDRASARDDFYARDLGGAAYHAIPDEQPAEEELEQAAAPRDDSAHDEGDEGDAPADERPAAAAPTRPNGRPRTARQGDEELRAALLEAARARRLRFGRLPASLRQKGVTAGVFVYGTSTVVVLR